MVHVETRLHKEPAEHRDAMHLNYGSNRPKADELIPSWPSIRLTLGTMDPLRDATPQGFLRGDFSGGPPPNFLAHVCFWKEVSFRKLLSEAPRILKHIDVITTPAWSRNTPQAPIDVRGGATNRSSEITLTQCRFQDNIAGY